MLTRVDLIILTEKRLDPGMCTTLKEDKIIRESKPNTFFQTLHIYIKRKVMVLM